MGKKYEEDDEIQIDLLELVRVYKKKLWLIILAALIGGVGFGAYSKLILTPVYTSTSMMYVLSKETTLTSLADLQIGSQLTNDYRVIVTSRPVLTQVIEDLQLDMTYQQLRERITIDNPTDTRILSISIDDTDPVRAKNIVDAVVSESSQYIGDIMEMVPPKTIEDGEVSVIPSSPNTKRSAVMGAAAGAFLVIAILTLGVVLDDTICTEDDVERYLELTVLSAVPERSQTDDSRSKGRKRGKKK